MKNLINAMNNYGDGEEEGSFNPEDFFAFGKAKTTTDNPFSQDNLKKVGEEIKTENVEGAQTISNSALDSMETSGFSGEPSTGVDFGAKLNELRGSTTNQPNLTEEEKLPERTVSTNNRFNSFQETTEVEEPTVKINIEMDEDVSVYIEPTPLTVESSSETEQVQEVHSFEELEKVAVKQDSTEVARMLDNKSVDKTIVEDEIVFNIDEDEEDEIDTHIEQETNYRENFYKEPIPETDVYNYNQHQNEPVYNGEQREYSQSTYTDTGNSSSTVSGIPLYPSRFGEKFRPTTELKSNEFMLTLDKFKDNADAIGDAYIESAKVVIYGESNKRVDYRLLIANGIKINAAQFNAPQHITNEEIGKLIGGVYKVEGKWNTYRRKEQIVINGLTDTRDSTKEDFIGTGDSIKVFEDMYDFLLSKVRRQWVRTLIESVMVDDGFLLKIKQTPAGLSNHDTGKDGLFRHKVKVTLACYQISLMYPTVDLDVLIASGLLHDIGKVFEMGDSTYTDIGITSGHISIGYAQVREKLNQMSGKGFPVEEKVALNILHCILSHHGKLEYGSPTTPKTREAWIIHLCDMIDTNVTHIDETLSGNKPREYSTMFKHDVMDLNIF